MQSIRVIISNVNPERALAWIAQLVEHVHGKDGVPSSTLGPGSISLFSHVRIN